MIQAPAAAGVDRTSETGVALVFVLWVLALLAVLALAFAGEARTALQIARNHHEAARARALADAGIALGLAATLTTSRTWRIDGEERVFALAPGSVRVALQDENGKIDINAAPGPLLQGLFRSLGLADEDGAAIVAALLDSRADRAAAARQQEKVVYSLADRPMRPGFQAVEELRDVPGITREIFERVQPFVTVHTAQAGIDPRTAPTAVLRALPNVDAAEVERFIRQRADTEASRLPLLQRSAEFFAEPEQEIVSVRAEAVTAAGTSAVRSAVVAIDRDAATPYRILAWRRASSRAPAPNPGQAR